MDRKCSEKSVLKTLIVIFAVIGILVAIGVAIELAYKKYKKCLENFNCESDIDYFDDDAFCENICCDCEGLDSCDATPEVCCEYSED